LTTVKKGESLRKQGIERKQRERRGKRTGATERLRETKKK